MDINWTTHLSDDKQKEDFKRSIWSAKPVLERLADMIKDRERSADFMELSTNAYETPSWSHKQAHLNGARAERNFVQRLITLDQKERK